MTTAVLDWGEERLEMLPERALWLPQRRWLLLADVHLAKAEHAQALGVPVPSDGGRADLERLAGLGCRLKPRRLFILGDLVHHPRAVTAALEEQLCRTLRDLACPVTWIEGNHDRQRPLAGLRGEVSQRRGGLWLSHAPEAPPRGDWLNVCGHVHPVAVLAGAADRLRLPCFALVEHPPRLVLPAFGCLTGGQPASGIAAQWVVADGSVLRWPSPRRRWPRPLPRRHRGGDADGPSSAPEIPFRPAAPG